MHKGSTEGLRPFAGRFFSSCAPPKKKYENIVRDTLTHPAKERCPFCIFPICGALREKALDVFDGLGLWD